MIATDEIKAGDVLRENDPRAAGRTVTVIEIDRPQAKAIVRGACNRTTKIALARIYTDDKPRKSGFSRVRS
jgi:hypothetical protein